MLGKWRNRWEGGFLSREKIKTSLCRESLDDKAVFADSRTFAKLLRFAIDRKRACSKSCSVFKYRYSGCSADVLVGSGESDARTSKRPHRKITAWGFPFHSRKILKGFYSSLSSRKAEGSMSIIGSSAIRPQPDIGGHRPPDHGISESRQAGPPGYFALGISSRVRGCGRFFGPAMQPALGEGKIPWTPS